MRPHFTIRVYGLLVKNGSLLISDERIKDRYITKLPGGGLEYGEGTIECLIREFKEELDLEVKVLKHFYTTDFFVASAFDPSYQVMSIYYFVETKEDIKTHITTAPHDYSKSTNDHAFRWMDLRALNEEDFTFPIDKKVINLLKEFVVDVNARKQEK
jgi:ADP-ribose pyrophosphatase YjhB (NUDIX family)